MSAAPSSTFPKQGKGKKEKKRIQSQQNERLKIVVRRLPPNLPEDIFWQSVLPWVTEDTTTWKVFYPGKLRKRLNQENIPSRAYVAFRSEEQLAVFSHQYDGHTFRDKNGVESHAVVEFAPYPKIPSDKKKADNRSGTIEKDEDYISFIESLKAAENVEPVSIEALIASAQPAPPPKTTPLLEALKAEKTAAKDKEAILRNHAHYKQGDAASRREDRKKAMGTAPPPLKGAPEASTSKKVKKLHTQDQSQVTDGQPSGIAVNPNKATPRNAPLPGSNSKSVTQNSSSTGPPSQTVRPPRPPRPSRQAQSIKASASTAAPVAASNMTSEASVSASAAKASQAEQPRRTRPVIGIASRQFEAALNIAGLANSASDRRKREKEKEVISSSTADSSNATMSKWEGGSVGLEMEEERSIARSPPPSPRKERSRRGGRPGGAGRGGMQSSDAMNSNAAPIKIPSILQRSDNSAGPTSVVNVRQMSSSNADSSTAESPSTKTNVSLPPPLPAHNVSPPRGRGRRGRGGRGRGRGGEVGVGRGGQIAASAPRESG